MIGWSPGCYIPSFVEIGPSVLEKKIFEGFFTIYVLVKWPALCHQIFISLYLRAFVQNLVQIGKVVSKKIQFEFLFVHDLGSRWRNDLDLQYSHTFIKSISCRQLPTFRSLATIVSEKSTVFTFSHRKAYVTKFDLAVKSVKVTEGSSFEKTMIGWSPQCYIPSFVEIGLPVLEKKILKGF